MLNLKMQLVNSTKMWKITYKHANIKIIGVAFFSLLAFYLVGFYECRCSVLWGSVLSMSIFEMYWF